MVRQVGEAAATTPGKRSLAMESFAAALRAIPATICDNAGASWQFHRHVTKTSVPGNPAPESFAAALGITALRQRRCARTPLASTFFSAFHWPNTPAPTRDHPHRHSASTG